MSEFNFPLEKEAPGIKLKKSREAKKIEIEEAAKHLHIRKEYLVALENDQYELLPSGLYGRQFLKKYCRLLKLSYKKILADSPLSETELNNNPFSQKIPKARNFLVFPQLAKNLMLLFLFLILILYLLFYFKQLNSPPKLIIEYPEKNLVTNSYLLTIKGLSDPETEIIINGNVIMSAQDGSFNKDIQLKSGLNTINISAKKKHGQDISIQRQILVEDTYEQ